MPDVPNLTASRMVDLPRIGGGLRHIPLDANGIGLAQDPGGLRTVLVVAGVHRPYVAELLDFDATYHFKRAFLGMHLGVIPDVGLAIVTYFSPVELLGWPRLIETRTTAQRAWLLWCEAAALDYRVQLYPLRDDQVVELLGARLAARQIRREAQERAVQLERERAARRDQSNWLSQLVGAPAARAREVPSAKQTRRKRKPPVPLAPKPGKRLIRFDE